MTCSHSEVSVLTSTQLCNISIAVPRFRRDFGRPFGDDHLIPAGWQIALLTASAIGMFFGALLSGFVMDSLGKLRALQVVCTISIGAVFMQVFARGPVLLLVGRVCVSLVPCIMPC